MLSLYFYKNKKQKEGKNQDGKKYEFEPGQFSVNPHTDQQKKWTWSIL